MKPHSAIAVAILLLAYFAFMGWQIKEASQGRDLGEQHIYNIVKE